MSQMDYSRRGCKRVCCVQVGTTAAFSNVCFLYVWVKAKEGQEKERE